MDARAEFRAWVAEQKAEGLTQKQIAERVKCSESALSRLIDGKRGAGLQLAHQVQVATRDRVGGPIPAEAWLPEASLDEHELSVAGVASAEECAS